MLIKFYGSHLDARLFACRGVSLRHSNRHSMPFNVVFSESGIYSACFILQY